MLSTVVYSLVILIVVFILSSLISLRVRLLLPDRLRRWSNRTALWVRGLFVSRAEAGPVTLGDVLVLAGFAATLVTVFYQFQEARLQTAKESLEMDSRRLHELVANQEAQIREQSQKIRNLEAGQKIPQLKRPEPDTNIIARHVDFEWDYAGHNPNTKYVVEMIRLADSIRFPQGQSECTFDPGQPCRFPATDPAGHRSRLPLELHGRLKSGTYYWRVVPGDLRDPQLNDVVPGAHSPAQLPRQEPDLNRIGDWSDFGSFTVYPSIKQRIIKTNAVHVGTNFLQDTWFSRRGLGGEPEGHDIDLIRLIVQGCMRKDEQKGAKYDAASCKLAVADFVKTRREFQKCPARLPELRAVVAQAGTSTPEQHIESLRAEIVPVADWDDWLGMLRRKEIDVFIGQATRAEFREDAEVKFTKGYYPDKTVVMVKRTESCPDLKCLTKKKIKLGVIKNTTNHKLAELLTLEPPLHNKIEVVPEDTFPILESAIDHDEVRAILIDGSLGTQLLDDLKVIEGVETYDAYQTYLSDPNYIGFGKEEFGIAVAMDVKAENDEGVDLRSEIDKALQDKPILDFISCIYYEQK
jgi:ABC-type amino acid transport substrate-binding protein